MCRTTRRVPSPGPTWTTLEPNPRSSKSHPSTTSDHMPGPSPSQQKKRRQFQPNTSSNANSSPLSKRQRTSLGTGLSSSGSTSFNANSQPSTSTLAAPRQHLPSPKSSAATRVRKQKSLPSIGSSSRKQQSELEQDDLREEKADTGSDWSPPPPSLAWLPQLAASGSGSKRNTTKAGPSKPSAALKLQRKSDGTPQQPAKRRATFSSAETIELSSDTEIGNIPQSRPSTSPIQGQLSTSKSTSTPINSAATKRRSTAKSVAIIDLCSDEEEEEEAPRKRQKITPSNAFAPELAVVDLCSSSDEEASVATSRPSAGANKGRSQGSPSKSKPPSRAQHRPFTRSQPQPQDGIMTGSQQNSSSSQKRTPTQLRSQNTSKTLPRPPAFNPRLVKCARKSAVARSGFSKRIPEPETDSESEPPSSDPPQPSSGQGQVKDNTSPRPPPQIQAPVSPLPPPPPLPSSTSSSLQRTLLPSTLRGQSSEPRGHLDPQQSQEPVPQSIFSPREFVASQMEQHGLIDGAELGQSHNDQRSTSPLAATVTRSSSNKQDQSKAQFDPQALVILADALQRVEVEKTAQRKPSNQESAQDIEADRVSPRRSTRVFKPTLKYQQLGIAVLPLSSSATSTQISMKHRSKSRSTSQAKFESTSWPISPVSKVADSAENEAARLKGARTESGTKGAEKNKRKEDTPLNRTSHSGSPGSSISSSSSSSETTTTSISSLGLDASANLKSGPSSVTTEPEPEGKDKLDPSLTAKVAEVEDGDDDAGADDAMHVDEVEDVVGNGNDDAALDEDAPASTGFGDANSDPNSLSTTVLPPPAQAMATSPTSQSSAKKPVPLKPAPHPTLSSVAEISPQISPQSKSPLQGEPKLRPKPKPPIDLPTPLSASEVSDIQRLIDVQRENLLSKPFTGLESTSKLSHILKAPDTPPALAVPIALSWPVTGFEVQEVETTWTTTWFERIESVVLERVRIIKERERERMKKAKESEMLVDKPEEVADEMDVFLEKESASVVLPKDHPNSPLQARGGELQNNKVVTMVVEAETCSAVEEGEQNEAEVVLPEELPMVMTEPTPQQPEPKRNSPAPLTSITTNDLSSLLDLDPQLRLNLRLSPEEKALAMEHLLSHPLVPSVPSGLAIGIGVPMKMVSEIGPQAVDKLINGDLDVDVVEEMLLMYPDEDI